MRKLIFLILFFIFAPLNLTISLLAIISKKPPTAVYHFRKTSQLYAALPQDAGEILGTFQIADARPIIIEKYLKRHQSPLLPYNDLILKVSDKYGVDYRLIMAIAMCESNLCKKIPPDSYNCWGFENGETKFSSWEEAFNQVAKTLKERYLDKSLLIPEEIMPKYAPPSVEKGGPWAKCVNQFIQEIDACKID